MMKKFELAWNGEVTKDGLPVLSSILSIAAIIALLLGVVLALFEPLIGLAIIGTMILVIAITLQLDQFAATLAVAAHLYVDWYLGMRVVALGIVLALLLIAFLARSPQRPWVHPRALWLWILLLLFAAFPAMRGYTLPDGATYYLNIFFGALITFWLGIVLTRDMLSFRRSIQFLSGLGALLAIHTLIQATTGTLLFGSSRYDEFLVQASDFQLAATTAYRFGSFFVDPNWNGTFFATVVFLSVGLFFESKTLAEKVIYLIEILLMLLAMLYTFSNGAWAGCFAGLIAFIVLVGRMRYRIQIFLVIFMIASFIIIVFPTQLGLQIQHATASYELSIRLAAWQTGMKVIQAFPLTGVGLGLYAYLYRAEPYRGIEQRVPLAHPHNSYLEIAAMAGLPVLAVFVALLLFALWLALRNWSAADLRSRSLLGGGIAAIAALSINSLSINAWTLAPLATLAWLILGALSSPLLTKALNASKMQKKVEEGISAD